MRRRTAAVLAVASIMLAAVGLAGPARARAPLRAAAPASIRAALFSFQLEWSAPTGSYATAEVRSPGGAEVKWKGLGSADAGGVVRFQLDYSFDASRGSGGGLQRFGPGDVASVHPAGGQPISATLANLKVAVDASADRVLGLAPPGAVLAVHVRPNPNATDTLDRAVTADASGRWALDLAGERDLLPGGDGHVAYTDPAGHQTIAYFAALRAEVVMGATTISGRRTLGNPVSYRAQPAGGEIARALRPYIDDLPPAKPAGGFFGIGLPEVESGMTLFLDEESALPGASRAISLTVPALDLVFNVGLGTVAGHGPPGTGLMLEAENPAGLVAARRPVATDASGAFQADVSDLGIDRAWRLWLVYDPGLGLSVRLPRVIPGLRVPVYTYELAGLADPGTVVSATVRSASGMLEGGGQVTAAPTGDFAIELQDAAGASLAWLDPGDRLEVDVTGTGDPIGLTIPRLSAHTDLDAERISGEALPGARVWVTAPTKPEPTVLATTADAAGRYTADFAGKVDIEPPMLGSVVVADLAGHLFTLEWAAVGLTVEVGGNGQVSGIAPAGRRVAATLLAPDDAVVGSAKLRNGSNVLGPEWTLILEDTLGQYTPPRPGDRLRVEVGDDIITLEVPPLAGAIHVDEDLVAGKGLPGRPIMIAAPWAGPDSPPTAFTTADSDGFFSRSFKGVFDFLYYHGVKVTMDLGRHRAEASIIGPGLRLSLGAASLEGSVEPAQAITVTLRDAAGQLRARQTTRTNAMAGFDVAFRDTGGNAVVPHEGDTVTVDAPGAQVHKRVALIVPELSIDLDRGADRVHGRATPGGRLSVSAYSGYSHADDVFNHGWSQVEIRPDGTWVAGFDDPVDLGPGAYARAEYRLPSGHLVVNDRGVPIANVQHGGARVCGEAERWAPVRATLLDALGVPVMAGAGTADAAAHFDLKIEDPTGRHRATEAGMTARVELGGDTATVPLPPVSVEVDWENGALSGSGPPRTLFHVFNTSVGCWGFGYPDASGTTGTDGRFSVDGLDFQGDLPMIEVAFFTAEGHRHYRQVSQSHGEVYIHTHRVGGLATPMSKVVVTLLGATGATRATTETFADTDGRFEAMLRGADGQPALIRAGDRVRLEASGESPLIEVEPLDFDFSPSGIEGQAPVGREVTLTLTLASGRQYALDRQTDDRGRWVFVPAMVPPRAGWTFDQIAHVRAALATAKGHAIVVEAGKGGREQPTVFLPWAVRTRP